MHVHRGHGGPDRSNPGNTTVTSLPPLQVTPQEPVTPIYTMPLFSTSHTVSTGLEIMATGAAAVSLFDTKCASSDPRTLHSVNAE